MKYETEKRGIGFIEHYGIRHILCNGNFFGITTFNEWNSFVETEAMIELAKSHFLEEIGFITKNRIRYVIRRKDLANNPFLIYLSDAGMCNGGGVYITNQFCILGFFFNARSDDKEAIQLFINHVGLFQSIVGAVDKQLITEGYWDNAPITPKNKKLFNIDDRRLIFTYNKLKSYSPCTILSNHKEITLTRRQAQILDQLKDSKSTKDLAGVLHLETRTIEWHIAQIKEKLGVHSKVELINVATTLQISKGI
jgi:DNA-binding CsgD family transcriptional regulator